MHFVSISGEFRFWLVYVIFCTDEPWHLVPWPCCGIISILLYIIHCNQISKTLLFATMEHTTKATWTLLMKIKSNSSHVYSIDPVDLGTTDHSGSPRRGPVIWCFDNWLLRIKKNCHTLILCCNHCMMTSSNGNIFRVSGPLYGEFTDDWWISLPKASDADLWCFFFICAWVNNRKAGDLGRHRAHYDVTLMLLYETAWTALLTGIVIRQ